VLEKAIRSSFLGTMGTLIKAGEEKETLPKNEGAAEEEIHRP
jgi:hypothetical protein